MDTRALSDAGQISGLESLWALQYCIEGYDLCNKDSRLLGLLVLGLIRSTGSPGCGGDHGCGMRRDRDLDMDRVRDKNE